MVAIFPTPLLQILLNAFVAHDLGSNGSKQVNSVVEDSN